MLGRCSIVVDEFEFIERIKQRAYQQSSLIKGIGDDAAIFRAHGYDIVTAVDTFVDQVHFTTKTASPFHIGYRALGANISDIAAMGAEPKFYLVSMVIPSTMQQDALLSMYDGMKQLASRYKMDLIGGDTVSGKELVVSITVIGYIQPCKARYRSDATEEDIVFVTGTLGDSAAGLYILLNELDVSHRDYFIHRHQMPNPRVEFAHGLKKLDRVCLNDVTDGVANELREIAEASDVTITINDESIPIHHGLRQFSSTNQHRWKYFGGEDFELIGTVSSWNWPTLQHIAKKVNIKVTKIGMVQPKVNNKAEVLLNKAGTTSVLQKEGYTHLK